MKDQNVSKNASEPAQVKRRQVRKLTPDDLKRIAGGECPSVTCLAYIVIPDPP